MLDVCSKREDSALHIMVLGEGVFLGKQIADRLPLKQHVTVTLVQVMSLTQ